MTIKDIIITVALSVIAWESVTLYFTNKRMEMWRDHSIKNGRAAIQKGKELRELDGQINRRAAKRIAEQNAVIEELEGEIRRLRRMNETYKKQLERSKS